MFIAKQLVVDKLPVNVPSRAAKQRLPPVAQSKLTLIKRPEQKPGLHSAVACHSDVSVNVYIAATLCVVLWCRNTCFVGSECVLCWWCIQYLNFDI